VSRKIVAERVCYERYAETHIAWNLRPNLQPARCLVGAQIGILVGSFVPKSESLWTLITQGRAEAAIRSLFTETLASWRDPEAATRAESGSIAPSLGEVFNYLNVRKSYLEAAAKLGFAREPQQVWEGFLNLPSRSWPRAPIHGDLHAENVRIRANDAILIDLAKATMGPPGADPACMEVWIAFEIPPPCAQMERTVWLQTVQELFGCYQVMSPPRPDPVVPNAWLRDAVIHTRRTALASTPPVDYAITLALYLLRRASFSPAAVDTECDAYRRTWAWILGCQLLEAVQDIECKYEEAA
jgi:hypothetical protein